MQKNHKSEMECDARNDPDIQKYLYIFCQFQKGAEAPNVLRIYSVTAFSMAQIMSVKQYQLSHALFLSLTVVLFSQFYQSMNDPFF